MFQIPVKGGIFLCGKANGQEFSIFGLSLKQIAVD